MIFLKRYRKFITQTSQIIDGHKYKYFIICRLYFGYHYYFDSWFDKNYTFKSNKYETIIKFNTNYEIVAIDVYMYRNPIIRISGYFDYNGSLSGMWDHINRNNGDDDTYAHPRVYCVKIYTKKNSTEYLHKKYHDSICNHFISFLLKDVKIQLDPMLFN